LSRGGKGKIFWEKAGKGEGEVSGNGEEKAGGGGAINGENYKKFCQISRNIHMCSKVDF